MEAKEAFSASGQYVPLDKSGKDSATSSGVFHPFQRSGHLSRSLTKSKQELSSSSPLLTGSGSINESGSVEKVKGSSWYATVILLVNTCIGAGMLNMASAFSHAGGLPVGIAAQIILSFLLAVTMTILCWCSDIKMVNTFQDVVYTMCGKKAMVVSSIAAVVYAFGLVVTFMIIIGDQLDIFLTFTYGPNYCDFWYMSRPFMMVITICALVLPLCYPARIDFLKYASVVGFVAIYYVVFYLIVTYYTTTFPTAGPVRWSPKRWTNVFAVIPTTCFAYQCHLSIVPIYSCLEKRNMTEFGKLMGISMVMIVFGFTAAGTFGYMTFGSNVNQDVLLSYKPVTIQLLVATILIAGKMYTDAPILSFVGRTAVDSIYCYFRKLPEEDIIRHEKKRRIVIATLWFIAALTIAVLLPHVGVVISVLGGFAALFSILIPGVCYLQALLQGYVVSKEKVYTYRFVLLVSSFYIIFGAFIFVVVVVRALIMDITGTAYGNPTAANQTCS